MSRAVEDAVAKCRARNARDQVDCDDARSGDVRSGDVPVSDDTAADLQPDGQAYTPQTLQKALTKLTKQMRETGQLPKSKEVIVWGLDVGFGSGGSAARDVGGASGGVAGAAEHWESRTSADPLAGCATHSS